MAAEQDIFEELRNRLCTEFADVEPGFMMRSPAITWQGKVFAFLSRKNHMVFKLGADHVPQAPEAPFNPFKKKGPLTGWYEVPCANLTAWETRAYRALQLIQQSNT